MALAHLILSYATIRPIFISKSAFYRVQVQIIYLSQTINKRKYKAENVTQ